MIQLDKLYVIKKQTMQSVSKKILITNSSWQIFYSILRACIGFISTVFIAKTLGPARFGQIQYVFSIYYFLQLVELFSHHSIIKQMLLEKKYSHNVIMGSSFFINLSFALALFITSSIIAYFLYDDKFLLFIFIAAQTGLIARALNNISFYFDSVLESKKTSFSQFIGNTISNFLRVVILCFNQNLIIQSILFSIQFFITSLTNFFFYKKSSNKIIQWELNTDIIKEIIKLSTPLLFTALASIIFLKIDIIMLEHLASTEAVGIYSVAVKLSEPWFFISGAIITSFFPSVILIKSKTLHGYYYKLTRLNSIVFFLGISISIFMSISAYYWIHYLFGSEYQDAIRILQVHVWGLVFIFWSNLQHLWEVKEKYLTFAVAKACITSLSNIGLNFYLIPRFQGLGAAYATIISYFIAGVAFNLTTKKSRYYLRVQLRSILIYKYLSIKEFKEVLFKK